MKEEKFEQEKSGLVGINELVDALVEKWKIAVSNAWSERREEQMELEPMLERGKERAELIKRLLSTYDLAFLKKEQIDYLKANYMDNELFSEYSSDSMLVELMNKMLNQLQIFKTMSKNFELRN
jgi:hypothetical protein